MRTTELDGFYNDGFGWICRLCEIELKRNSTPADENVSRLMSEGEAESKNPKLSNIALAQWTDKTNRTLMCPRCGITEPVDKF